MKTGPPAKPLALKLVQGNPGKRALPKRPVVPPITRPDPPEDLSELAQIEWRRVVGRLADLGLMSDIDLAGLAAYCDAFGDWQAARRAFALIQERSKITGGFMVRTPNGGVQIAPLVSIIRTARADMVRFASEFGMTPASRAGMDIDVSTGSGKEVTDPADSFFA